MFKSPLLCFLLSISLLIANGQKLDYRIPDQLHLQIRQSRPDTNRVKFQLQLGGYYLDKRGEHKDNLDSAFSYFNDAIRLSHTLHSVKWKNEALALGGRYYITKGDLEQGKASFMQIINYYRSTGNKEQQALTWKKLGDLLSAEEKKLTVYKLQYYGIADSLFHQTNDRLNEFAVLQSIADVHLNEKKLDLAQSELLLVLDNYKSLGYKKLQDTYNLLGEISKAKIDLHKELFYRIEAVKCMEATHDTAQAAYYYAKLALVYADLAMYSQSVIWIIKAMDILKKNDPEGDYYGDLSLLIYDLTVEGKAQTAINFLHKVETEVPPVNLAQRVDLNEAFGNCYKALKQYEKAEQYYLVMMQTYQLTYNSKDLYSTNLQMVTDYIHYYQTMEEFYILTKQYEKADYYIDKILLLPKGVVRPITLSRVNRSKFQVDSALGNYISAIKHFETHIKINDSLYNMTKSQQIAELNIKYEIGKKEQSIKLLQSESKAQHAELQKVNLERNITLGGAVMLIIIAGLAYNGYRHKQQSNRLLQSKQDEINRQNVSLQLLLNDKDKLLSEKDWLLKEVHHRVKNNLQIVMSLLNTQSAYLENRAAITAIRESQNRVQAISLIHQKLYSTSNVASIDMPAYVSDLVNYLRDCLDTLGRGIRFEQLVEPIKIDLAQAVPLGLILNEAITNAIKYAFDDNKGEIIIAFQMIGDENLLLTITDNGKGLPADFDIQKTTSLGMEMMKALSKQLGGSFQIKGNKGVTISIEFQIEKTFNNIQAESFYS